MSTTTTTWSEATPRRADNVEIAPRVSEDWLSLIIGLFIFVLALAGIANVDLLGWVVTTSVWNNIGKALGTVSKSYSSLGGFGALVATYVALLVVLSAAAVALKSDLKKFALAFTAVFWIAYASWVIGNFANFAAVTPADLQKFGITWSLRLTNEGAYIFALVVGLVIANVFPLCGSDQGRGEARTLHQDRDRHPRWVLRRDCRRKIVARKLAAAARRCGDH